jgi:hypothetical protein
MWRCALALLFTGTLGFAEDVLDNLLWRNPVPTGNNLEAVIFADQTFVAVGGPEILTSLDGTEWIPRRAGTTNHLRDVVHGHTGFVVVGDRGTVLTSPDGIVWTSQTLGPTPDLYSITYGQGRFVTVGRFGGGGLYYSDDGLNWTISLAGTFFRTTYGDGRFIAFDSRSALVSTNAVNWLTNAVVIGSSGSLEVYALGHGNGFFLAAGQRFDRGIGSPVVLKSSDAAVWQSIALSPLNAFFSPRAIGFGPSTYLVGGTIVAGPTTSGGFLQSSPDTVQWTLVPTDATARPLKSIAYGNGRFVAVGDSGSVVTSTDGVQWFPASQGENRALTGITFGHAGYVAVGDVVLGSGDGFQYTKRSSNAASAIAYGNNAYAGVAGGYVLESTNAAQWTVRNAGGGNLLSIAFANGRFVAVGDAGAIRVSSNARAWSGRFSGTAHPLYAVTHGSNGWIAVGGSGTILSSQDTFTWTGQNSDSLNHLFDVTHGDQHYVAVGQSGTVLTSIDGENWILRDSGTSGDLLSVAFGRGIFAAAGIGHEFLTSTNGVNWTRCVLPASVYPYPRVHYVNDTFMFVGGAGMILQTPSDTITLAGQHLEDTFQITLRGGQPGAVLNLQKCTHIGQGQWQPWLTVTNELPLLRIRDHDTSSNAFYRVISQVP